MTDLEALRRSKDWRALVQALIARAEATEHPEARAEAYAEAASIAQLQLDDIDLSVDLWRQTLDADPDQAGAVEALEQLYTALERWSDLQELYAYRLANAPLDTETRVALLMQLANLMEWVLEQPARALELYEEVLGLNRFHEEANEAVARLRPSLR